MNQKNSILLVLGLTLALVVALAAAPALNEMAYARGRNGAPGTPGRASTSVTCSATGCTATAAATGAGGGTGGNGGGPGGGTGGASGSGTGVSTSVVSPPPCLPIPGFPHICL